MHPRVLAMYHSSFQPKESLQCMIIPCNQNSPCYVPSCLPKQKSPHKVSQGITLKESLLFLNHLFTRYELWKTWQGLFLWNWSVAEIPFLVGQLLCPQTASLWECLVTFWADIQLFISMEWFMFFFQRSLTWECLVTLFPFK